MATRLSDLVAASGNVAVTAGGTGRATLTAHGVLVGNGTSAIAMLAAAAVGTLLAGGGASADPAFTATPVLGIAGTTLGSLGLSGNTSGVVTLKPQAAAGTYNFNLPITAGSSGDVLTSGGGGSSPMTWSTPVNAATTKLSAFAATSSAELAGVISDETGTGPLCFSNAPTLVGPILGTPASGTLTNCTGLPAAGVLGTAAILAANTFTATQTITPAVNTNAIACTGFSLTGTDTHSLIDLAGTWNIGTTSPNAAIKLNVTDIASNSAALLMDLQVGGVPKFNVDKTGRLTVVGVGSFSSTISAVSSITSATFMQAAQGYFVTSKSGFDSAVDGNIRLINFNANDFGRLQFGGTTSSFPSLKRSTTVLQAKLADDSAFAPIQGLLRTGANAVTGLTAGVLAALTNASIVITDATGQDYRVPVII